MLIILPSNRIILVSRWGDKHYAAFSCYVSIWSVWFYRNICCGLIKSEIVTTFHLDRKKNLLYYHSLSQQSTSIHDELLIMWCIQTYVYVYKRPKSETLVAIFKSRSNREIYLLDNLINTHFQMLMDYEIVTDCISLIFLSWL